MRGAIAQATAACIGAVRLNSVVEVEREGRRAFRKTRRLGVSALYPPGDLLLRWSDSRCAMFASVQEWVAHELHGYALVHGPERRCGPDGSRGLWVEALPGLSVRERLHRGLEVTPEHMAWVAAEVRRAHALSSDRLGGARWSHGDLHAGNVLIDTEHERAHLIDFETRHRPGVPDMERRADDLWVLTLELPQDHNAPRLVDALLEAYGDGAVCDAVRARQRAKRGFWAEVLWRLRVGA